MSKALTKAERAMYAAFSKEFRFCWACGIPAGAFDESIDFPITLERAHIVGGAGRVHERCDLAMLCAMDHRLYHGDTIRRPDGRPLPKLRLDHILWLQYRFEGRIDRQRLRELRGKLFVPTPTILPAWHLAQFHRWHGCEHSQWRSLANATGVGP